MSLEQTIVRRLNFFCTCFCSIVHWRAKKFSFVSLEFGIHNDNDCDRVRVRPIHKSEGERKSSASGPLTCVACPIRLVIFGSRLRAVRAGLVTEEQR